MKRDGQEQEMPVFPVNSQRNMVIKVGGVEASNIRIKTGEEIEYLKDDEWVVGTVISYNSIKIQDKEVVELPANTPIRLKKNTQTSGILVLDIELYSIEYGSSDLQMMYQFLYGSGIIKDKLFGNIIASGGRQITVQSSMYVIDGFVGFFKIPQNVVVDIGDASVRKDLLVLRKVQAEGSIYLIIKKGVPSPNPSLPELTQNENGIYEIPVAEITVQANAQTISQGDIKDIRPIIPSANYPVLPLYFTVYPEDDGTFDDKKRPANYFKRLYNITTTWKKRFAATGAFERHEGGFANESRSGLIQPYAMKRLSGNFYGVETTMGDFGVGGITYITYREDSAVSSKSNNGSVVPRTFVGIDSNRVSNGSDNEGRSTNILKETWELKTINGVSIWN